MNDLDSDSSEDETIVHLREAVDTSLICDEMFNTSKSLSALIFQLHTLPIKINR